MKKLLKPLIVLCAVALMPGCATVTDPYANYSEPQLFNDGMASLANGDYQQAISYFEAEESMFPYGPYAQQESMNIIYAYYQNDDFPSAQSAANLYIKLYPLDKNVDYAYYMKAMSDFALSRSFLVNYFSIDPSLRDLNPGMVAFNDFQVLIQQFPNSQYVTDARQHMIYIRNMTARNSLAISEYYYTRGAYIASLDRAHEVVFHYQGTPSVPDALIMMVRCYHALGLTKDEAATMRVLSINYPEKAASMQIDTITN
jgi:outer membrane protein assembly factor BamD